MKLTEQQAVTLETQFAEVRAAREARNLVAGQYRTAHRRLQDAEHALRITVAALTGPPAGEALSRADLPPGDVGVEADEVEAAEDAAERTQTRVATGARA